MEKVIKVWLKYYPVYLSGLWGTLWISAVTVFLGALLGMVVALMRMSRLKILRTAFNVYVEILRGTPILLQLYFFWIGLPKLVPFELTDTQCIVAALVETPPPSSPRSSGPVSARWTRASGRPPGASAFPRPM